MRQFEKGELVIGNKRNPYYVTGKGSVVKVVRYQNDVDFIGTLVYTPNHDYDVGIGERFVALNTKFFDSLEGALN